MHRARFDSNIESRELAVDLSQAWHSVRSRFESLLGVVAITLLYLCVAWRVCSELFLDRLAE